MATGLRSQGTADAGKTHLSGEMFVAAELAKRHFLVSLTMGNAKAVDLFAEQRGRAICIQVKAIANIKSGGWPLPFDKSKIVDGVMYVCVILNEVGRAPSYYVLPPREVRRRGKWFATRATLSVRSVRNTEFAEAWHLISGALKKPRPPPVSDRLSVGSEQDSRWSSDGRSS